MRVVTVVEELPHLFKNFEVLDMVGLTVQSIKRLL